MGEELQGREVAQSLVRADAVVGMFLGQEFAVQLGEGEREGGDLIELLGMGAVGAFDLPVELGRAGRQDKELHAALGGKRDPQEAGPENLSSGRSLLYNRIRKGKAGKPLRALRPS